MIAEAFGVDPNDAAKMINADPRNAVAVLQFVQAGKQQQAAQQQAAQQQDWSRRVNLLHAGDARAYEGLGEQEQAMLHREATDAWNKSEKARLDNAETAAKVNNLNNPQANEDPVLARRRVEIQDTFSALKRNPEFANAPDQFVLDTAMSIVDGRLSTVTDPAGYGAKQINPVTGAQRNYQFGPPAGDGGQQQNISPEESRQQVSMWDAFGTSGLWNQVGRTVQKGVGAATGANLGLVDPETLTQMEMIDGFRRDLVMALGNNRRFPSGAEQKEIQRLIGDYGAWTDKQTARAGLYSLNRLMGTWMETAESIYNNPTFPPERRALAQEQMYEYARFLRRIDAPPETVDWNVWDKLSPNERRELREINDRKQARKRGNQ
jgi:hypothetical protein